MFISQHFPLASSRYTIIILLGLFLRNNKGNKIVCFQNFCPKFVLTQKLSSNVKRTKTRSQKRIKIGYFPDTDIFRTSFFWKRKAIVCLFFWKNVKIVFLAGEPASSFFIPYSQQVPMPYPGISWHTEQTQKRSNSRVVSCTDTRGWSSDYRAPCSG